MNTEPSLQPSMAVAVPGAISGDRIIDDLLNRIADRLGLCGDLRGMDAYTGYAAKVSVELQLFAFDTVKVNSEVSVGVIDPARPVVRAALGADMTALEADSSTLEKPVDPAGITEVPAPQRRVYVSRVRGAGR